VRTTAGNELGRWVYTEYETGEKELYRIDGGPCWRWDPGDPGDPCELRNRVDDPRFALVRAVLADVLATAD
jgi:hypothetical protein